ncbi:hypothetical protein B0J13DRAFT_595402 [Dactylonectria estremocensis]|uniref:leucine--tRNA ligase n=1 Tax=Dactylonectria estremocensis TaxID=1079267 RepID=A0A9P9EVU1_9HYPO|nr:hypothetical protein B0J13DRAFT_595402 [Dactylonectria estremocensis]
MTDAGPSTAVEGPELPKTKQLRGTEKRDSLVAKEKKYQKLWADGNIFEANAPSIEEYPIGNVTPAELRKKFPNWMGTMAFPYQNGRLHAGHVFSVSKVEFGAGVARMQGKQALFPMGYHATGMPIKAVADKLKIEIETFGKDFSGYKGGEVVIAESGSTGRKREDVTKFLSSKSKANAKTAKLKFQFQIMESMGIPKDEIHRFADPQYWLTYFPPRTREDLTSLGCRIDWRRSFITTDINPYFDSFVQWQMRVLKKQNKIKFGKRYTIYSVKDGQPCMDHDRSEGEGIGPQEYTGLKMKVLKWNERPKELPKDANVFLIAATLRPETMYGQTAVFVSPRITYGIFKASEKDYYAITHRAARNMAYQGIFAKDGEIDHLTDVSGADLIGTLVLAPLSIHTAGVRVLPMESILPAKGTGIVASVPSDSPTDFITMMDLCKKAQHYGIRPEWAELEIISIIETPRGDQIARILVEELKINSPKDAVQLDKAKDIAFTDGFYKGKMKIGAYAGESVESAKPRVRKYLIEQGFAFPYAEPENKVISRSSDDCIVALMDQWYIDYGEESWKQRTLEYLHNGLNTYGDETRNAFDGVLNWLSQWACARSFGLGSRLPWDTDFLVESLSDSTIYMAYYTICHMLHADVYGHVKGPLNVGAEQMTDEVWDYIFCRREFGHDVLQSKISKASLEAMRRSFSYEYPLTLRSSGKDLINNHLTFSLYMHLAIWEDQPEYWPKGIRCNGHLMLNGEKMSKSTGNFMTLQDLVGKYGADATRIGLADAGDGIGDSNLVEDSLDSAILRLYTLRDWIEDTLKSDLRRGEFSYIDKIFVNEMNSLTKLTIRHYTETNYKLALKTGLYDFNNALSFYREYSVGATMHHDLVTRYVELQCLLIAVIAPHWAEAVWIEILRKPQSIQLSRFPQVPEADAALSAARKYMSQTSANINSAEGLQMRKRAKGKDVSFDPKKAKKLTIYMNERFPAWQNTQIELFKELWDPLTKSVDDKVLASRIDKTEKKRAMAFLQSLKKRVQSGESEKDVFDRKLPFDEEQVLVSMLDTLKRSANLKEIQVLNVQRGGVQGVDVVTGQVVENMLSIAESAVPANPAFFFANVDS